MIVVLLCSLPVKAHVHIDLLVSSVISDSIATLRYSRHAFISYMSLFVMYSVSPWLMICRSLIADIMDTSFVPLLVGVHISRMYNVVPIDLNLCHRYEILDVCGDGACG